MPSEYVQNALIQAIVRFSDDKDIRIVDISCGDGATLKKLFALGYTNLTGTIYGEDQAAFDYSNVDYEKIRIVKNVNLLETLPFDTHSVDVVINSELLEHIENHRHAVAELTRIIKPNGLFVFETPNIMRLQSRFNFFLSGFHKPRTPFPSYHGPFVEHLQLHSFPVYLPLLDYFLHHHGMKLEKIAWNGWKAFSILLLIAFFPFILLNSIVFLWKQEYLDRRAKMHIFKMMHHPAILLCNVLILTYRKSGPAQAP